MTEDLARCITLALMDRVLFQHVSNTEGLKPYEPALVFTDEEIAQARIDRATIAERYNQLKQKRSFWESETIARMEFLSGL